MIRSLTNSAIGSEARHRPRASSGGRGSSWKDLSTISTVATAGVATLLLLVSPELGIAAAAAAVALGAISAGLALMRPSIASK
jgi:hypothetical protein